MAWLGHRGYSIPPHVFVRDGGSLVFFLDKEFCLCKCGGGRDQGSPDSENFASPSPLSCAFLLAIVLLLLLVF